MSKTAPPKQASLFPIWLIRSKVHPTKQRVDMLERPALIEQLDQCLDATLSLLHAPAGYGKSTLLADWRSKLLQRDVKVCWLSLDQEDNELFQLLTYIAFSLAEGGVDFAAAGIDDDAYFTDLSPRNFLSVINHVIETEKEKVVLILDDFENLDREAVAGVVKPLLDYAPDNLHIAVASRDDSKLKITNLETKGLVVRIPSESMRFSLGELTTFFADQLSGKTIEQIYRFTEGWPVTIQMLRNSIAGKQDIEQILTSFKGSSGVITTYLSEQIFQNLDSGLQQFLMDISLMDRISCSFADYLRESGDSMTWFEATKPLNTLVLPVEQVEQTYRLHPLFREYLYERLTRTNPQRAVELHSRAADRFAAKGNMVKAVGQAMRARQPQRAIAIIGQAGGITLWPKEGLTRLRAVLKLLDEETIQASPRIRSIQCLIEIKDGKVYQARNSYDEIVKRYQGIKAELPPAEQEQIEHELLLLESLLACYEGKVLSAQYCERLKQNIARIDPDEHTTLAHHFTLLCLAYVQRGMFKEARANAERAVTEFKQLRSVYGQLYIHFHLGDISFAEGRSDKAENHYQTGLNMARQYFNDDMGIKLVANVLIAELKYELNQTHGLTNIVATIPKQLEEREAWFDIYAAGYITASNMEFDRYGIEAAISVLDCAAAYAKAEKLTRLTNLLIFQRIELLIRSGQEEQARAVLSESEITLESYRDPDSNDIAWRECDAAVRAITRLQIKDGQFDEALAALTHFTEYASSYGQIKSSIRYEILQSLAYRGKKISKEAFKHLERAVTLSVESGFIRSFIDEGGDLKEILEDYIDPAQNSDLPTDNLAQVNKILACFAAGDSSEDESQLLSKREYQVLQQLVHGFSNKVIARNIDISENTVRFHLKNIFAKLHVDNRLQAVTAAQKRNII